MNNPISNPAMTNKVGSTRMTLATCGSYVLMNQKDPCLESEPIDDPWSI
jgi:hypothetical protein